LASYYVSMHGISICFGASKTVYGEASIYRLYISTGT